MPFDALRNVLGAAFFNEERLGGATANIVNKCLPRCSPSYGLFLSVAFCKSLAVGCSINWRDVRTYARHTPPTH